MIIKVGTHKCEIEKSPVNELEVNVTKIQFEFDEALENLVKEAYFTLEGHTYKVLIQENECYIPNEVLIKKGTVEIGVVAFEVENEETITRYNPSPVYINTWEGSLKEADNTEPITPTDKEQIEQALLEVQSQMDNLDIEAEKVEDTATITIIGKDGEVKTTVQIKDGEKGEQGEPGVPGAVKFIIVQTLPTTDIQTDAIYLVPKEDQETTDLYDEYMYVNNEWELLGQKQITVDLTDYVKNTDYATASKGGVINKGGGYAFNVSNSGNAYCDSLNYSQYTNSYWGNTFISKGTLENVIAGKGLVSNTNWATDSVGGVVKVISEFGVQAYNGYLSALVKTYAQYQSMQDYGIIGKGTLENVLTAKIGDIDSVLDAINGEVQ